MRTAIDGQPAAPARADATGVLSLVVAVLIFGAANAVVRKLSDLGAQHLVEGRNAISFCNVLFAGNLCALGLLAVIYRRTLQANAWRQITGGQMIAMTAVAALGTALAPALMFSALSVTSVNNVVLISRIEPPLLLALSVILLDEKVNRWVVAGATVSLLGVLLTILLQPRLAGDAVFGLGNGEFWTAIAAIALSLSTIVSKVSLREIPLGVFSLFRVALGTAVFFVLAVVLFGPGHFTDIGAPLLWRWMVFYGAGIVVAGQLLWYYGLRRSAAREVSLASTLNPVAGLLAAFLILGEAPTRAQIAGGLLILAGMLLNQRGLRMLDAGRSKAPVDPKGLAGTLGFKGV
jgi:drug/metabolite transporter (DMT)-like permease